MPHSNERALGVVLRLQYGKRTGVEQGWSGGTLRPTTSSRDCDEAKLCGINPFAAKRSCGRVTTGTETVTLFRRLPLRKLGLR